MKEKLTLIKFIILLLVFPLSAFGEETISYGELLLETESPKQAKQSLTLFVGDEIDNVFFQSRLLIAQYERNLNTYLDMNVEFTYLDNSESLTLQTINSSELTNLNATKMNFGASAGLYFKPLFGQINFLSIKSLPFQIGPTLSIGMAQVESDETTSNVFQYTIGIKNNFDLTKKVSLQFALEENFRANTFGESENLTRIKLGLGYLF